MSGALEITSTYQSYLTKDYAAQDEDGNGAGMAISTGLSERTSWLGQMPERLRLRMYASPPEAGQKDCPHRFARSLYAPQRPPNGKAALRPRGLLGVIACSDPQRRNSFDHFRD